MTMLMINSVCKYWHQVVIGRERNKRFLRRIFHAGPHLVSCLLLDQQNHIGGVATGDGHIFIVGLIRGLVTVYEDWPPFRRLPDIQVRGLAKPSDLVHIGHRIYISDPSVRSIFYTKSAAGVSGSSRSKSGTFLAKLKFPPMALSSTTVGQLVVTPDDWKEIFIYDVDKYHMVKRVAIPDGLRAYHAVQAQSGKAKCVK